jgi:hypothetical protein
VIWDLGFFSYTIKYSFQPDSNIPGIDELAAALAEARVKAVTSNLDTLLPNMFQDNNKCSIQQPKLRAKF